MLQDLSGQVAVVTGASSGMGRAIARKFASVGSKVVLAARRKARLDELAREIKAAGGSALAVPTDVRDYSQVKKLVEMAIAGFGAIDIVVNGAGYGLDRSFVSSSIEEIDDQLVANLNSVCYGCHAVLPHMIARKSGTIVNIGSIASMRHFPNWAAYTAAKFGVLGLTRSIYEEVRQHGIRMGVLCPAAVNTEFGDVSGLGPLPWTHEEEVQPEDIADIVYLWTALPKNVHIEDVIVWPVCQPTA